MREDHITERCKPQNVLDQINDRSFRVVPVLMDKDSQEEPCDEVIFPIHGLAVVFVDEKDDVIASDPSIIVDHSARHLPHHVATIHDQHYTIMRGLRKEFQKIIRSLSAPVWWIRFFRRLWNDQFIPEPETNLEKEELDVHLQSLYHDIIFTHDTTLCRLYEMFFRNQTSEPALSAFRKDHLEFDKNKLSDQLVHTRTYVRKLKSGVSGRKLPV